MLFADFLWTFQRCPSGTACTCPEDRPRPVKIRQRGKEKVCCLMLLLVEHYGQCLILSSIVIYPHQTLQVRLFGTFILALPIHICFKSTDLKLVV